MTKSNMMVAGSASTGLAASLPPGIASLPEALAAAFSQLSLGDQFFDAVNKAALQSGCEMLFEIPAVLFNGRGDRAAAISCGAGDDLLFIAFDTGKGSIFAIAANEVPETVVEFTRSYACVLGLIACDRNVTSPLLQ